MNRARASAHACSNIRANYLEGWIRDIALGASMSGKYEGKGNKQFQFWTGVRMEYAARAELAKLGLYEGDAEQYRAIAADAAKFVRDGIM